MKTVIEGDTVIEESVLFNGDCKIYGDFTCYGTHYITENHKRTYENIQMRIRDIKCYINDLIESGIVKAEDVLFTGEIFRPEVKIPTYEETAEILVHKALKNDAIEYKDVKFKGNVIIKGDIYTAGDLEVVGCVTVGEVM